MAIVTLVVLLMPAIYLWTIGWVIFDAFRSEGFATGMWTFLGLAAAHAVGFLFVAPYM